MIASAVPHPDSALAEPTPHLDENGACDCMCADCTVKEIGPAEMWRCICPDCDAASCGGHGEGGFD